MLAPGNEEMERKILIDKHERGEAEQRQHLCDEQRRAEIKLSQALEKRKQKKSTQPDGDKPSLTTSFTPPSLLVD